MPQDFSKFSDSITKQLIEKISSKAENIIKSHNMQATDYAFAILIDEAKKVARIHIISIYLAVFGIPFAIYLPFLITNWSLKNLLVLFFLILIFFPLAYFMSKSIVSKGAMEFVGQRYILIKLTKKFRDEYIATIDQNNWLKLKKFSNEPINKKIFQIHQLFHVPLIKNEEQDNKKKFINFDFIEKIIFWIFISVILLYFFIPNSAERIKITVLFLIPLFFGLYILVRSIHSYYEKDITLGFSFRKATTSGPLAVIFSILYIAFGAIITAIFFIAVISSFFA